MGATGLRVPRGAGKPGDSTAWQDHPAGCFLLMLAGPPRTSAPITDQIDLSADLGRVFATGLSKQIFGGELTAIRSYRSPSAS